MKIENGKETCNRKYRGFYYRVTEHIGGTFNVYNIEILDKNNEVNNGLATFPTSNKNNTIRLFKRYIDNVLHYNQGI